MKSLFRILAVTIALLLFAAALMFYLGGQQMEFKAETLIKNTANLFTIYFKRFCKHQSTVINELAFTRFATRSGALWANK